MKIYLVKYGLLIMILVCLMMLACQSDRAEKESASKAPVRQNEAVISSSKRVDKAKKTPVFGKEMEREVKGIPSEIAKGVFQHPSAYIGKLVGYLGGKAKDDLGKVKLFHDWIADNIAYDANSYFKNRIPNQSYESVLKTRKSVCQGNANLLKKMCDLAGIESEIVTGYSRGYGHQIFDGSANPESNHAWNAVKSEDGEWHLVDVTWDAGYLKGNKFVKEYSTNYLFLASEKMIYTHIPDEKKWWMLPNGFGAKNLGNLPKLKGYFFGYGLELLSDIEKVNEVKKTFSFKVKTPKEVYLNAHLFDEKGKQLSNAAFIQKEENVSTIHLSFPKTGNWTCSLFARYPEEKKYVETAEFGFINQEKNTTQFPKPFQAFEESEAVLYEPLSMPLSKNKEQLFKVRIPNVAKAAVVVGKDWVDMKKDGTIFSLKYKPLKKGKLKVMAARNKNDENYMGLLEWKVK